MVNPGIIGQVLMEEGIPEKLCRFQDSTNKMLSTRVGCC